MGFIFFSLLNDILPTNEKREMRNEEMTCANTHDACSFGPRNHSYSVTFPSRLTSSHPMSRSRLKITKTRTAILPSAHLSRNLTIIPWATQQLR